jgi:hypothetical protein
MKAILWILQILLTIMSVMSAVLMLFPPATLTAPMDFVLAIPPDIRAVIAFLEIVVAVGLILPGLIKIQPQLTPLAAAGFVVIMVGLIVFNVTHQQYINIVFNSVLLLLSAFVAYMRWIVIPVGKRNS